MIPSNLENRRLHTLCGAQGQGDGTAQVLDSNHSNSSLCSLKTMCFGKATWSQRLGLLSYNIRKNNTHTVGVMRVKWDSMHSAQHTKVTHKYYDYFITFVVVFVTISSLLLNSGMGQPIPQTIELFEETYRKPQKWRERNSLHCLPSS